MNSWHLQKTIIITCVIISLLALMVVILKPRAAQATDLDWNWDVHSYKAMPVKAKAKRTPRRQRDYDRDNVRLYRAEEQELVCARGPVRGLGTQWIGTEGALDAARKDWMERVRFDLGESYLDLTNARGFISSCGRVSIGETLGQVMYRCQIRAVPCKAPFSEGQAAAKK